jgi:nucleoside-specific outer membrane channel protein Tsx
MQFRTLVQALAAASLLAFSMSSQASDWNDTSLAVKVGEKFGEPGISMPIKKTIYEFVHISGDKVGKNLVVGQILQSDSNDPAAGGNVGSQEFFGFYRRSFSLSALSGSKIAFGPVKDVSALVRFDRGPKNILFAAAARKVMAGIALDWDVPKGYVETSIYSYHEKNYNGFVGREVEFDPALRVDTNWAIPLNLGVQVEWHGAIAHTGKKGKDGFGNQTRPETRFYTEFLVPVGSKTGLFVGVGFEAWRNKYGADQRTVPGVRYNTAMLVAEYHF